MNALFDVSSLDFVHTTHRNKAVILCKFAYNPPYLQWFKATFPSALWSRTLKAWYLPDNTLYRNRLNIPMPEVGDQLLPRFFSHNQQEFIKFRNALIQKVFSPATIKTYLNEFGQLLELLKSHPVNDLTAQRINAYFLYCIKTLKHTENQVYSRLNAIKCYFKLVLRQEVIFDEVIRPKPPKQLPKVLSKYDVGKLFATTSNEKHLLLLKMAYGIGLRVSELINLKVEHIDLHRAQVHIVAAKGIKDRYINFPTSLVILFEDYLKIYQPQKYLFEGQLASQYSVRSAQMVFKNAMDKANIKKSVGIHGLRYSYVRHLKVAGTDMVFIQKLLKYAHVQKTEIYARVTTKTITKEQSPLDSL